MKTSPLPNLYVDLDGTLIATDLLYESVFALARRSPLALFQLPIWLMRGKAVLKRQVAQRVQIDASELPYRDPIVRMANDARAQGQRVVLATASDHLLAAAVAQHLGCFHHVIASDGEVNMSGGNKLAAIQADAAGRPIAYAGNASVDLSIWIDSDRAIVASNSQALRDRATGVAKEVEVVDLPRANLRDYLYGLRLHQWLKNLLVFLPLLPILASVTLPMALSALYMFVAFGLCASSTYVFNDLLDLSADRRHRRKRMRPFASGLISIPRAVVLAAVLLFAGGLLATLTLPPVALVVLLVYMVLTTLYSTLLKRRMLVDVFALAFLYTIRVLGGAAATQVEPSFWLLSFSMFIFLSLALVKRYVEIRDQHGSAELPVSGRAYVRTDDVFALSAGMAAGQLSILTLSLYLVDPAIAQRFSHPYGLWLLCPLLLYWLVRIWLKAHRGELHDDPVVFAATDRISQIIVVIALTIVYLVSAT